VRPTWTTSGASATLRGGAGETARLVKIADLRVSADRADSDALRQRYEQSLPLVQRALATAVA
jgi:hypothetical protein